MRSAQCCVAVGGDSPEALRALELFRKVASPAAIQVIEDFMIGRTTEAHPADAPRTLDEFLLAELRRPAKRGEGDRLVPTGPFVTEWQAFARGAMGKDRSTVQSRAWTQWEAFGGAKDRAKPLVVDHDEDPFAAVMEHGVVRIDGCLSTETATSLRRRVLAERDACVMEERADGTCACRLSRVLGPRNKASDVVTRWDVRLPLDSTVRAALYEAAGGQLGDTIQRLCGGDQAELFECAALITAEGAAPQVLHSDTVLSRDPQLFTATIALQDVSPHHGPSRFLPFTHSGGSGARYHRELARHETPFCKAQPSVTALLATGDCALYDSRTLHSGGPHRAPKSKRTPAAEQVHFYVSFRHAAVQRDALSNADVHGTGSILPELSVLHLQLGQLRKPYLSAPTETFNAGIQSGIQSVVGTMQALHPTSLRPTRGRPPGRKLNAPPIAPPPDTSIAPPLDATIDPPAA